jgi:hypothetical protein
MDDGFTHLVRPKFIHRFTQWCMILFNVLSFRKYMVHEVFIVCLWRHRYHNAENHDIPAGVTGLKANSQFLPLWIYCLF